MPEPSDVADQADQAVLTAQLQLALHAARAQLALVRSSLTTVVEHLDRDRAH